MTGESEPPVEQVGRFRRTRDEALYVMAQNGWGAASDGDINCPTTGWFARISNTEREIPEIAQAFAEEFSDAGFDHPEQLKGSFLVTETQSQTVIVVEYDSERELEDHFLVLQEGFRHWVEQEGQS